MDEFLKHNFEWRRKFQKTTYKYNPIFIKLNSSPGKLNKLFVDISICAKLIFLIGKDIMNTVQDNNDFGEAEEWDIGGAHCSQVK